MTPTPNLSSEAQRELDIIQVAFVLAEAVARFVAHARAFCYAVMLSGHVCPTCGGVLAMVRDGACRCLVCAATFDPTVAFQTCERCGGRPRLRIRRYECGRCHAEIVSRFLFDGRVFDATYFRQKMTEHRERKQAQHERVRQMLAGCRSCPVEVAPLEFDGLAALRAALDGLTRSCEPVAVVPQGSGFDLQRYERHVLAHSRVEAISLTEIPPLIEDPRRDLIFRFIAIIFLAHGGVVRVWQESSTIWVSHRETDREGQAVPGDVEDADGVEGPVGRAEA